MNNLELVEEFLNKVKHDGVDCFLLGKYCEAIKNVSEENKLLKRQNKIKDKYCELIYELGFDYDGLNTVESLKGLIDDLVDYAKKSIKNDDNSFVFEGMNGTKYNILREKIDEPRQSD